MYLFFFFNDTATTEIYTYGHTLSLHDALPICASRRCAAPEARLSQPLPQRLAHTHISARGGSFSPHAKLSPRHLLPGGNALAVPTMLAEGAGIVGLQSRPDAIGSRGQVYSPGMTVVCLGAVGKIGRAQV